MDRSAFKDRLLGVFHRGDHLVGEGVELRVFLLQRGRGKHVAHAAAQTLIRNRAITVSEMKPSTYFGKRVCFLALPNMSIIELVEE